MAVKWFTNGVGDKLWSKPGNWNDSTKPGTDDDCYADGISGIIIDEDISVKSIRTDQRTGGTAGGGFQISSNRTLTCNIIAGTTTCLTINTGNYNVSITAYNSTGIRGGSGANAYGISNSSTGTVSVTGNATGSSGNSAFGISNNTGTVSVTGNATGGSGIDTHGIFNSSTGTVIVTGSVTGGSSSTARGISNNSSGTVYIYNSGSSLISPISSTNTYAVYNTSTGTIQIGTLSNPHIIYGGRNQPSVYANNGYIRIYANLEWDTVNSNAAALGTSVNGVILFNGNIKNYYDTTGYYGLILATGRILMSNAANTYTYYAEDNGSGAPTGNPAVHYGTSLHSGSMPAVSDVRYGTTYGPGGMYTGTAYIPSAASVAYGVPVDNTTGTAVLTPSAVDDAVWNSTKSGVQELRKVFGAIESSSVVSDAGNTATTFKVAVSVDAEKHVGRCIQFDAGTANAGQIRRIVSVNATANTITVNTAFDTVPTSGDMFTFVGYGAS